MPALASLAHMELNGFGFSDDECEKQRKIIIARLDELEQEAYRLAGRNFALTSPDDVCQVWIRRKTSSYCFLLSPFENFYLHLGNICYLFSRDSHIFHST